MVRRIALAFLLSVALSGYGAAGAAGGAGAAGAAGAQEAGRPNILFILVDDLGWMDTGFNNPETFYETPALDRLAAESTVFTRAYAAASVSSPTRASILSGKAPARVGMTDFIGARKQDDAASRLNYRHPLLPARFDAALPLEEVTLAEALGEAGYRTFFAGKWNVGPPGFWPEDQGFDVNRGGWTIGAPQTGNKYFSPYDNPRLQDGPPGEYLPERLAQETISFIDDNAAGPFFAYLCFYSVHTPLMTRGELVEKYTQKAKSAPADAFEPEHQRQNRLVQNHPVYAGMVESVDRAVDRVVGEVERLGLMRNTIIIFASDNGGLSTSEGHPTSNAPLRAGKGWLYEGGVRVPMFIRWPALEAPPPVVVEPVVSMDFYPTILQMAGLDLRPQQHVDGRSMVPLLRGESLPDRALYWHYPHYSHQGGPPVSALRSGSLKYLEYYEDGARELYDLSVDPGERHNLIEDRPAAAEELRAMLFEYLDDLDVNYPTLNPNQSHEGSFVHERVRPYRGGGGG